MVHTVTALSCHLGIELSEPKRDTLDVTFGMNPNAAGSSRRSSMKSFLDVFKPSPRNSVDFLNNSTAFPSSGNQPEKTKAEEPEDDERVTTVGEMVEHFIATTGIHFFALIEIRK